MIEASFPEIYTNSDQYAVHWQRQYLWSQRLQLAALVLAAGAFGLGSWGPALVVILFVVALLTHLYRFLFKADQRWWDGRALAESAKTLSWRYVVMGLPFSSEIEDADVALATRLAEVATGVAKVAPISSSRAPVTSQMKEARALPLGERRALYRHERIQDQMAWYHQQARANTKSRERWGVTAVAAQALGVGLAVWGLMNEWNFNYVGLFSAIAASLTAWAAVKQFDVQARAYAVASVELGRIDTKLASMSGTELEWAEFVNEAEEAISKEHTSWLASRAS